MKNVGLYSKLLAAIGGMAIVIVLGVVPLDGLEWMVQIAGAVLASIVVYVVPVKYRGKAINILEQAAKIDIDQDGDVGK